MDEDGYPTDGELESIRKWDGLRDPGGLIEFIKYLWWAPDWAFKTSEESDTRDRVIPRTVHKLELHTGGWSGNESIIEALQSNPSLFWYLFWTKSERGGHYYFDDSMVADDMKWKVVP